MRISRNRMLAALLAGLTFAVVACSHKDTNQVTLSESERFNQFADKLFDETVMRSPQYQTMMGIKKDYDKLDDLSEKRRLEDFKLTKKYLKLLQAFNFEKLDEKTQMSHRLLENRLKKNIRDFKFRHHNYPVNQMFGVHSSLPAFMINMHRVKDKADLEAYISRISQVKRQMDQVVENLSIRQNKGIVPPKFVYARVLDDIQNLLRGRPFTDVSYDSPLLADFVKKLSSVELPKSEKDQLQEKLENTLLSSFKPGYLKLYGFIEKQSEIATADLGAWKLPHGEEFYRNQLAHHTTTTMSADEVHQIGLNEVKRIHKEMIALKIRVGFKGNLKAFFEYIKETPKLRYSNDEKGRKQYLADAQKVIDSMKKDLPKLFNIKPKAGLIVKPVEKFREKSAGMAFYQGPTPDGSRPGIYYVNLYDMNAIPKHELEALAYHEALPGHHMQIAIAKELEGLPKFRKNWGYTAYTEGWGLYSEFIPKEIGKYADPYSDFGRLSYELWRATRLVVDTGIHAKKWTYNQAVQYLLDTTPNDRAEIVKAVERYTVMPGQATAYKVGKLKILELRENARAKLGKKFDIRKFHDEVLRHGSLPLTVLEKVIGDWTNQQI